MTTKQIKSEIKQLLNQIDETYWGPQERQLIDQALSLSQQIGDEALEYKVRIRLTSSASQTGDNDAMLSSFAWCLAKHDADPRTFPNQVSDSVADLMWQFKWMAGALDANAIFSLAQCDAMLDDMEAHYVREDLGMSGVITARFQHTWTIGDIEAAKQLRARLIATPRDDYSHCDACNRSELAGFAVETGEVELALKLVDEIVENNYSCGEEPEHALSRTLITKLQAGRDEDAVNSHMRSYRLARRNPDNISIVADNMVFAAITGNQARGLAMVERHLLWLTHDNLNQLGQFNMLTAIGMVLESVARVGHGDQVVRGANSSSLDRFFGLRDQVWTVGELVPIVWQAASQLAQAFDTRNGNNYRSNQIKQTQALLDTTYNLPILTEVFLEPEETTTVELSPQHWLELAEIYAYDGSAEEAIDAGQRALDGANPTQRARALQLLISSYAHLENPDAASALLPDRIQALRDQSRPEQADLEARVGLALYGFESDDQIERLEAELIRLADSASPELADVEITLAAALFQQEGTDSERGFALLKDGIDHADTRISLRASGLRGLAGMSALSQDLEEAIASVDQILAMDVSNGCRASVLTMRAQMLGGLQRYEQGAVDADAAAKIYANYRAGRQLISATVLASALMQDAGRIEDEIIRLRYALREATRLEIGTTGIRYRLGQALNRNGHPLEAIEILWDVLKEEEQNEAEPASRAETCEALARAFEADDRYGNAVAMYEQAADLFIEGDQPPNASEMLRRKGNIQRAFERYDDAIATFSQAWDLIKDQSARGNQVLILEAWAFAKASNGQQAALQDIDKAINIVETDPEGPFAWKVADLIDSKARILVDLTHHEEAATHFQAAAAGYAQAGDLASASRARHFAAQELAGPVKQPETAIAVWRQALTDIDAAIAEGEDQAELRNSIILKLSATLEELGHTLEASQVGQLGTV